MASREARRSVAQELMWDAMDLVARDPQESARLCREALQRYPDCVDALAMLAELECERTIDYVEGLRQAVEAGRRDLGAAFFKRERGYFWGLIETRPFMRAMAQLAFALLDWGTPERIDEAIEVFEEMLELNPEDNQGVRDWLAGCYLARKRYGDAADLFGRYPEDWLAAPAWARVLLAFVTEGETRAIDLLGEVRDRNPHVEAYLTGHKRRSRARQGMYSPGDETEAAYDQFGAVSISGDTAVVGAHQYATTGWDGGPGFACVFDLHCGCAADFNGDGVVDTRDFIAFLSAWAAGDTSADFDGNGTIDTRDFIAYLNLWAAGC